MNNINNNYNIHTSYFSLVKNNSNSLSLIYDTPSWYILNIAEDIAPPKDLYNLFNNNKISRKNFIIQYSQYLLNNYIVNENVYPSICPNYDHSPRSKFRGTIIVNSTPQKWKKLCHEMFSKVSVRSAEDNLVFIKAWNEWGEGNYLEPDLKYGTQFLDVIRDVLEKVK